MKDIDIEEEKFFFVRVDNIQVVQIVKSNNRFAAQVFASSSARAHMRGGNKRGYIEVRRPGVGFRNSYLHYSVATADTIAEMEKTLDALLVPPPRTDLSYYRLEKATYIKDHTPVWIQRARE